VVEMKRGQAVAQFSPGESVSEQVQQVADGKVTLVLRSPDGTESPVDEVLGELITMASGIFATGRSVLVSDASASVSPTVAAQILGVSRPMVTRWMGEGLLEDAPVGTHHRIPIGSVMELRDRRETAGRRALQVMSAAETVPVAAARVEDARTRASRRIATRSAG
jgi:hypothetical protein